MILVPQTRYFTIKCKVCDMKLISTKPLLAGVCIAFVPAAAQAAVVASCSDADGLIVPSYDAVSAPYGDTSTVGLVPGQVLTITDLPTGTVAPSTPSTVIISDGSTVVAQGNAPFEYTMPEPGGIISINVMATDTSQSSQAQYSCRDAGGEPVVVEPPVEGQVDITPLVTGMAQSSLESVSNATTNALRARAAYSNGIQVSRTRGFAHAVDAAGRSVWGQVSFNKLSGEFDGQARNVVLGVDLISGSDVVYGALLAFGHIEGTGDGVDQSGRGASFGLYAGQNKDRLRWGANLTVAKPRYTYDGDSFSTRRLSFAVDAEGRYETAKGVLSPYVRLSGWKEEVPNWAQGTAEDIQRVSAGIGATHTWTQLDSGWEPWVSAGSEIVSRKSASRGDEQFTAPRFAVGVTKALEGGGQLSARFDFSWYDEQTKNLGFTIGYETTF